MITYYRGRLNGKLYKVIADRVLRYDEKRCKYVDQVNLYYDPLCMHPRNLPELYHPLTEGELMLELL